MNVVNPYLFAAGGAGFALIGSASGTGNYVTATTSAIDTTGATLLVVAFADYASVPASVITDSKGNTWNMLTARTSSYARSRIGWCVPTSVGSGHTVTAYGYAGTYPAVAFLAFSGASASPYDTENGSFTNAATSLSTGSLTPSVNNALVVAAVGIGNSTGCSIDNGFTLSEAEPFVGGNNFSLGLAYKIQTTATAVNPQWSWSGSVDAAATIASFKPQ
jgi:hypothetical protein